MQQFLKKNITILIVCLISQLVLRDFLLRVSNNFLTLALAFLPILWAPLHMPRIYLLLYAFGVGFIVDILFLTPGLATSVFTMMAFLRGSILPSVLKNTTLDERPSFASMGGVIYILYVVIMFVLYFIFMAMLEFWDMKAWFSIAGRLALTIVLNTFIALLVDIFILSPKGRHHRRSV